jgi:hypothetical protein
VDFYGNGEFLGRFEKILEGEYKFGVSLYMGARVVFDWGETEVRKGVMSKYV